MDNWKAAMSEANREKSWDGGVRFSEPMLPFITRRFALRS